MSWGNSENLQVSIQQPGRLKPVEIESKIKGFTNWNLRGIIYKEKEMDEVLQEGTKNYLY
jgi:hypothetical protein